MSRQRLLLAILAGLLLIVAWVYLRGDDDSSGTPARSGPVDPESGIVAAPPPPMHAAGASAAGGTKTVAMAVIPLHDEALDSLGRLGRSYSPGRDPWRFVEPPPPPPPGPPKPTKEQLRAMEEAEAARRRLAEEQARLAAIEAAKPHPPQFTLTYLGSFGPPERRIAVFSDGQSIFNVQAGQVLAGKFIVVRIGFESVDVGFVGFNDVQPQRVAVGH
ncbi:MAG TPA: hypothetical protein VHQ90_19725 [Thermoanaerobaculia bacterium]|nr:hypothetical protein [Thermoanaerobaculia bacterium]